MKRKIVLSAVLISGLILAGCQPNSKQTATSNATKTSTEAVKPNLGQVAGQSYAGTHKGNGKSTDPTYVYKISFNNDGSFGQEIISSDGYAARFIQQGTYKYDQAKKQIILKLNKVTETSYQSDGDLQDSHNPVRLSVRTDDGASSLTKLNAAENKPLVIKDKGSYLLGTVNNVKLTKDSSPVKSFDKLASSEADAYSTKGQIINQKTFNAKLGTSRIWMTFNDDGTWQCRIIDGTHRWDIYDQGTWTINDGQLALTTTGDVHEFTIVGDTTNPTKYSNVTTDSSRVTDNFTWKISGNDLVITSKQDSSMTANMKFKTSKVTQSYVLAQSKTKNNSSKDEFGSQDEFIKRINRDVSPVSASARTVTNSEEKNYETKFKKHYDGISARYICQFYGGNDNFVLVYGTNGEIYQLEKGKWQVSSFNETLFNDVSSDDSDSTTVAINSEKNFGQWIYDGRDLSNSEGVKVDTEDLSKENGEDDLYKIEFTADVSGVTPLYYAGLTTGGNQSVASEWIYGSDGKVYSHFSSSGTKWHADKRMTAKWYADQY